MLKKTILIKEDAYKFLRNLQRVQRGCKELDDEQIQKMFNKSKNSEGYVEIYDGYFGGGNYSNDYSKWTDWSIEKVKQMLDKQHMLYKDGNGIEMTPLYI